jgi:hypothetical protein
MLDARLFLSGVRNQSHLWMSRQTRLSEDSRQFRGPPTSRKYIKLLIPVKWSVIIFEETFLWISPSSVEIMLRRAMPRDFGRYRRGLVEIGTVGEQASVQAA